jgi:hypothetical protein
MKLRELKVSQSLPMLYSVQLQPPGLWQPAQCSCHKEDWRGIHIEPCDFFPWPRYSNTFGINTYKVRSFRTLKGIPHSQLELFMVV